MQIKIKKLHANAVVPSYATVGAGCFDLTAATVMGAKHIGSNVYEGHPVVCDTGLSFEVPDGKVMLVFSRSGHGFNNNVRLSNCVGLIDSDYRGSVKVKLTCDEPDSGDSVPFFVKPGDRVAQALILPIQQVDFVVVDELSDTTRGSGGLGSTGT